MSDGSGPPVLIGEKVWWLGSGSGLPKRGVVRWIGRLAEIGPDWALGIELEEGLPYGGVDGTWRGRQLFRCKPKHGLIVPSDRVLAHQSGAGIVDVQTRRDVSLLPLQNQVSAPPRLRRSHQERSLLLDRHTDFRSVHLEAVQIRRRIQQDQVVSLVLGQASASPGDVVLSREMTRNEAAVIPRARRTESLAARKEKTNSGLFSFLRWFRRENKTDRGEERSSFSNPGSPVLRRSDSAITGSVDTLFSTATAASFAYIRPESYHPFGEANEPEKWIFPGPETKTYKNRIKRRDELRRLNQNLSLREKYNLYASGSLGRSLDEFFENRSLDSLDRLQPIQSIDSCSSTLARKKRKAPVPPTLVDSLNSPGCDSLPTTLSKESLDDFKLHRRTVSESAKYKKKAYHVKGKRKAPPPPKLRSQDYDDLNSANTLRKKRKAPPPPIELHKSNVVNIPKDDTLDIIENDKLRTKNNNDSNLFSSTSKKGDQEVESVSSTDTLRLEKGILKPNKMEKGFVEPKHAPTSPVSPRPWYKRPQSSGSSPKQNDSKKKENKSIEDWMLESGFPRRSQGLSSDSKGNIFNKNDRPEDKRRSQISILTNISELDREAAEIIERGKEREKSLLASYNAKYYVDSEESSNRIDEGSQTDVVPKKATAKELISLFNSITNISRITVNSNFVAKDDLFSKNCEANNSVDHASKAKKNEPDRTVEEIINGYSKLRHIGLSKDEQIPGPSGVQQVNGNDKLRGRFSSGRGSSMEESRISKVTIEELDEYDSEKHQSGALTEEKNDVRVNPALTEPIISEISDSPTKSSSGSTICSSLLNGSSSSLSSGSSSGAKIKSSQLFSNYPLQKKISLWTCSRCTLENPRWRLTCEACDMWRPTVCDYKLCKKPNSPDKIEGNSLEIKEDLSIKPKQLPVDNTNKKTETMVDSETKDLIRNGQILASLSSQRASTRNRDQDKPKLISSPKLTKKPMAISGGPLISKDYTSERNKSAKSIDLANGGISGSSSNENNVDIEQADVVRKARLAFFSKTDSERDYQDGSVNTDSESVNNMDNISKETKTEKLKLRELLKEMKNSLPRQKKLQNSTPPLNPRTSSYQMNSSKNVSSIMKQNSFNESSELSTATEPIVNNDIPNLRQGSSRDQDVFHQAHAKKKPENSANTETKQTSYGCSSVNGVANPGVGCKVATDKADISNSTAPVIVDAVAKPSSNISKTIDPPRYIGDKTAGNSSANVDAQKNIISKPLNVENEVKNVQPTESPNVTSEKKAEAILIKSKFIIEEIKVKKKPEKVSSSAQTSTKILSVDDNSKETVKNDEVIVPITSEEYVLNDNATTIASSSVRTEPMKLDVKKFELMRPRDFANVINSGDDPLNASNNLQHSAPTPSTPSSSSSIHGLNLPVEPILRPSTSKGDGNAVPSMPMGTVALNRLLKKLEAAIAGGQHDAAAGVAKELALLKVPCSVVRHSPGSTSSSDILMKVLIEDKTSQKGPISMRVKPWVKLADLKRKMEKEHDIPAHLQRWFIDKKLASDDQANVRQLGIEGPSTPIFLYYIAQENMDVITEPPEERNCKTKILNTNAISGINQDKTPTEIGCSYFQDPDSLATLPSNQSLGWRCISCNRTNRREEQKCGVCGKMKTEVSCKLMTSEALQEKHVETPLKQTIRDPPRQEPRPSTSSQAEEREKQENYKKLVDLEKDELVLSVVSFECPVCFIECKPPDGVVLKECLHSFCKACLSKTVEYSDEPEVKCPFRDDTYTCDSTLLEREIKALVTPEVYEDHLAKSIAQAETKIDNAFHCKTPDCKGWCIYEDNVNLFKCPVCLHPNCLTCQAIHEGLNCKEYQEQLNQDSEISLDAKRTKDMLQEMVDRGEAMVCPRCKVVLMKKWGCDWLRCSMCKTEICWVTRGPRWGPNGKGDTSGGCQCGVNGVKCHPKCNYCH